MTTTQAQISQYGSPELQELLLAKLFKATPLPTQAQPVIAPDQPFGYFCDWGNNSKLYVGEPGNAIDDDWNKQPSVHKNLPLFVKQPERIFEIALLKVLSVVCRYLPPDGIAAREAIAGIIAIVDPWPDATTPQPVVEPAQNSEGGLFKREPLFATPQPAIAATQPLADTWIAEFTKRGNEICTDDWTDKQMAEWVTRQVEAALNITIPRNPAPAPTQAQHLKAAAQQALTVLRGCLEHPDAGDAISALQHAIAQPAKPEPVAVNGAAVAGWMSKIDFQIMHTGGSYITGRKTMDDDVALYTTPQPATALTEAALTEAAQAVVARWDTPLWKDVPATGGFINALRDALEKTS